jgi:hypothetical protein
MKKKVFCGFLLIVWLLAVCTILSENIERQMTAKVTRIFANSKTLELPVDALFWDENGIHLYKIEEGSGWNYGTRAFEVAQNEYMLQNGKLTVQSWATYSFIRYASKTIAEGDLIEVQKTTPGEEAYYLVLSENGAASLLPLTLEEPFMEAQAKSVLSMQEGRVYSLTEVKKFLENLPFLALLLAFLVVPVILWAYSCTLSGNPRKNKTPLLINSAICLALTGGLVWIGQRIDLPSSLLPDNDIFRISYYRQEFSEVFQSLAQFSGTVVLEVTATAKQNILYAGGILLLGFVFVIAVVSWEHKKYKCKKSQ